VVGERVGVRGLVLALVLLAALAVSADARSWAWLGVRIRDLTEQEMDELASRHGIREGFGVVIVEVLEGAPAARAGIKNGDIVVAFEDRPVVETRLLQRLIAAAPTDADTRLTLLRPEGRRQIRVRLGSMPREVAGDRVAAEFGFVLREPPEPPGALRATPPRSPAPSAPPAPSGSRVGGGVASVAVVLRGGRAEKAGLEVGDVILQIAERDVVNRDAAREVLADAPLDRPLVVSVRRGDRRVALTIAPP
jgi:serine protease Do